MTPGSRAAAFNPARSALAGLAPAQPTEVPVPGVLRTERMVLRPPRPSDRGPFIDAVRAGREHLERFSPLHREGETDEQLFERQLRLAADAGAAETGLRRFAFLHDGALVGAANLNSISRGLEWKADCNWWIGAAHLRRGLATEALGAVLSHALADVPAGLGLHSVFAWIMRDNETSIRMAARLGFRRAPERDTYIQTGSNWELHDLYVRRVGLEG